MIVVAGFYSREFSDYEFHSRFQVFVNKVRRFGLGISTCLLDVVEPGEHADAPVVEDGELLRQLLLTGLQHGARHGGGGGGGAAAAAGCGGGGAAAAAGRPPGARSPGRGLRRSLSPASSRPALDLHLRGARPWPSRQ